MPKNQRISMKLPETKRNFLVNLIEKVKFLCVNVQSLRGRVCVDCILAYKLCGINKKLFK